MLFANKIVYILLKKNCVKEKKLFSSCSSETVILWIQVFILSESPTGPCLIKMVVVGLLGVILQRFDK